MNLLRKIAMTPIMDTKPTSATELHCPIFCIKKSKQTTCFAILFHANCTVENK